MLSMSRSLIRRPWQVAAIAVVIAIVLSGCAGPASNVPIASVTSQPSPSIPASASASVALATPTPAPSQPSQSVQPSASQAPSESPLAPSEPVGLAVIGHSGATGYNSDPQHPFIDVRSNSWATGTNPDVQSIYLRLVAQDAAVEGHATNMAIDGSGVTSLLTQATGLVSLNPPPKLVIIQTIDNDMKCDGSDDANLDPYGSKLTQVLDTLTQALPDSYVFIVSQWADVKTYDRVVFALSPSHLAGTGPCDTVDPGTGKIVKAREASEQQIVDAYWGIVVDVCAQYPACRTDGGAMQQMDLAAADMTSDFNHLSVAGQAKMAAIAWRALSGGD
jgi:hypothetical protein